MSYQEVKRPASIKVHHKDISELIAEFEENNPHRVFTTEKEQRVNS